MMNSKYSLIYKSISLLLIIVVAQIYVMANPGNVMFGRLMTGNNMNVIVNGSAAGAGTTVLPGSQIQTAPDVPASVQLDSLGKLDVSPGANLTLNFSEGNVDINLVSGQAVLKTYKGVNGSITYKGKTEKADSTGDVSILTVGTPPQQQSNNWNKKGWTLFGLGVGGGLAITIILITRGDDESPSTP